MTLHRHRGLVRISAPAAEPLTLIETKEFMRIDSSDDDARINDMIIAARTLAEQWLKRSLVTQHWKLSLADCATSGTRLPMGPLQSIASVITTSAAGVTTTLDPSAYAISPAGDAMMLDGTLYADRIDISYIAGYGASGQVPKPIKLGLLQHVAAMYDGTAAMSPIPDPVLAMYMPFRELSL
jgi:uncharacterized phiE125 gp8 family phage protein